MDTKTYNATYYKANRNRILQRKKEAGSTNGLRHAIAKTNAKKRNIPFLLTLEQHAEIIKDGQCHYCQKPLPPYGSSLDRKNNERYYDITNSVPCCRRCNETFMHNYTYEEKLMLAKVIQEIDQNRLTVPR